MGTLQKKLPNNDQHLALTPCSRDPQPVTVINAHNFESIYFAYNSKFGARINFNADTTVINNVLLNASWESYKIDQLDCSKSQYITAHLRKLRLSVRVCSREVRSFFSWVCCLQLLFLCGREMEGSGKRPWSCKRKWQAKLNRTHKAKLLKPSTVTPEAQRSTSQSPSSPIAVPEPSSSSVEPLEDNLQETLHWCSLEESESLEESFSVQLNAQTEVTAVMMSLSLVSMHTVFWVQQQPKEYVKLVAMDTLFRNDSSWSCKGGWAKIFTDMAKWFLQQSRPI